MLAALTTLAQTVPSIDFSPMFSPPPTAPGPTFSVPIPIILFGGLFMGLLTSAIWSSKGGSYFLGFMAGFMLGLIGLVIVVFARPSGTRRVGTVPTSQTQAWQQAVVAQVPQRPCPDCGQGIQVDQPVCPSCQQPSEPWRMQNGVWVTRNDNRDWWLNPQTNQWQLNRINKFCPSCRAEMQPQDAACPECGALSNALQGI